MDTLLTSQAERFDAGSAIVVIMPPGNREVIVPLRRAMNYGVIVTVILLDTLSFGGETDIEGMTRSLINSGLHVYIMRRGSEVSRALDSRLNYSRV